MNSEDIDFIKEHQVSLIHEEYDGWWAAIGFSGMMSGYEFEWDYRTHSFSTPEEAVAAMRTILKKGAR